MASSAAAAVQKPESLTNIEKMKAGYHTLYTSYVDLSKTHDREYATLSDENATRQKDNAMLVEKLKKNHETRKGLQDAVLKLLAMQTELQKQLEANGANTEDVEKLNDELATLRAALKVANAKVRDCETASAALQDNLDKNTELNEERTQKEQDASNAYDVAFEKNRVLLEKKDSEIATLKAEIATLKAEITRLKAELVDCQAANTAAAGTEDTRIQELQGHMATTRTALVVCRWRYAVLVRKNDILKEANEKLIQENKAQNTELAASLANVTALQARIAELEERLADVASMQLVIDQLGQEKDELLATNTALQQELYTAKTTTESHATEGAALQLALDAVEEENADLVLSVATLQSAEKKLQLQSADILSLAAEMQSTKDEMQQLNSLLVLVSNADEINESKKPSETKEKGIDADLAIRRYVVEGTDHTYYIPSNFDASEDKLTKYFYGILSEKPMSDNDEEKPLEYYLQRVNKYIYDVEVYIASLNTIRSTDNVDVKLYKRFLEHAMRFQDHLWRLVGEKKKTDKVTLMAELKKFVANRPLKLATNKSMTVGGGAFEINCDQQYLAYFTIGKGWAKEENEPLKKICDISMHSLELDKLTEFLKGVGLSNVEHITQDELFFGNNLKRRLVECDLPFMQNLPLDENNQISQKDLEKFIEKSYVNVDALIKSIENVDSATAVFALTSANLDSVVLNGVLEKYKDINTDEVDLIAKVNGLEELATVFRKWIDAKSSDSDLQVFNFVQSYLGRGEVEKNSIEAARDLRADLIAHRYAYNKLLIPSKFKYYTKARLGLFLIELLKTDDAAAPVDPTNSIPIPLDTALLAQFAKDVNVGINIKGTLLDFEEKNRKLFASILINLQSTFLNNPITSEDITTYLDRSFSDVDANDPLFGYDHLDNNDNFNSKIEKIQSSDYKPFTTNASTKMMMRNVFDILFGQRTDFLAATLSDKSFHRLMYEAGKLRKDLDKDERRKGTLVTNFMSLMAHANYDQRQPCNKQGYIDDINVALHTAPELNDVEFACSAKTTKTSGGGIPDKSKYEYQTVVSSLENAKVKINDAKLNVNDIMASYKAIANQIKIEDASASISNQEGLQAAYDEYISSIQPLFQKTKESLSIVANALKLALETDESDQIDRLTNSLYAITEVKDLKRSADAITHICDKFEKTMNNIFSLTNGNRSASSASSANATTPPVIWFSPPTPAQTPPAAAGRSVQIFGRPSAEHESIIEKITKINPLIDNLLSHYKEYVAAFNTPSGIPGEPMPTLISDVYNNYIERSKVDKSEALDNLYLDVKRNNLDIKRVLALTMMDRVAMIFITLFLRIIAVSITEWTISRGYVTTITSSLTVYLVCYTALFIIFAIFVNLDQYRLRIIFNYVNFNRNTPLIFIHIASLWSLAFLIYKLLTSVNMPLSFWDTSAMSDEEQYRLMYRIEMLSFLVWTIMACMIGFM